MFLLTKKCNHIQTYNRVSKNAKECHTVLLLYVWYLIIYVKDILKWIICVSVHIQLNTIRTNYTPDQKEKNS